MLPHYYPLTPLGGSESTVMHLAGSSEVFHGSFHHLVTLHEISTKKLLNKAKPCRVKPMQPLVKNTVWLQLDHCCYIKVVVGYFHCKGFNFVLR